MRKLVRLITVGTLFLVVMFLMTQLVKLESQNDPRARMARSARWAFSASSVVQEDPLYYNATKLKQQKVVEV